MKASTHQAKPKHKAFRDDLTALMKKHSEKLSAQETLAIAAHMVGQIIAMQDQRTMTNAVALEIVARNIEQGNQEAMTELLNSKGTA